MGIANLIINLLMAGLMFAPVSAEMSEEPSVAEPVAVAVAAATLLPPATTDEPVVTPTPQPTATRLALVATATIEPTVTEGSDRSRSESDGLPVTDVDQSGLLDEWIENEIYTALDYGYGVFTASGWSVSAEERADRTVATWTSNDKSSIGYIEYLHFENMADDFTIPDYINGDYFDITLASVFSDLTEITECSTAVDGLYLYEFSGTINGVEYHIRYWAEVADIDRVAVFTLEFPATDRDILETYAARLFPELPICGLPE